MRYQIFVALVALIFSLSFPAQAEEKVDCSDFPVTAPFSSPKCFRLTSMGESYAGSFTHYNFIGDENRVYANIVLSVAVYGHLYIVTPNMLKGELIRVFDWIKPSVEVWSEPETSGDVKFIGFRFKNYRCKGFSQGLETKPPGYRRALLGVFCLKNAFEFSKPRFEEMVKQIKVQ